MNKQKQKNGIMMKMRHIITALFIVTALLCFAGCGKTEKNEPHETEHHSEENVNTHDAKGTESERTETVDKQNTEILWEHKDIMPPKVPDLKLVVQSEEDGCKSIVVDTTMNWKFNDLRKYVDEVGFAKNWDFYIDSGNESVVYQIYTDISNQVTFNTIESYSKYGSDDQEIGVTIYTDTSKFAGVKKIVIKGAVKTDVSDYQDALYELARKCFGDEYAEFVVYGTEKGDNGKYEVKSSTEKFWYQNSQKYASFNFSRELTFENGLCSFDFSLYFIDNNCTGSNYPSSGGYKPHLLNEVNDMLQTVLPALGTYNPYTLTEYGRTVFSRLYNYDEAYLDKNEASFWHSQKTNESNEISFHHTFKFNMNDANYNDAMMHPELEFNCSRSAYKNTKKVVDRFTFIGTTERININTNNRNSAEFKNSEAKLFEKAKKEFSVLFPEIDVKKAEFGKSVNDETTGNIVEINGIKYKYNIKFDSAWASLAYTLAGRWTLSLTTLSEQ